MIRTVGIALLALGSAAQAAQQAPATTEESDARCLAVFSAAAASEDKAAQDGGKVGAIYFAGKLRGRNPSVDFETVLRRAFPSLEANSAQDGKRCVAELQSMGAAMTAAGAALQKKPN
jgi:hypothetical protein